MPLSEHEQRLLDQMEQALKVEDPKFASHMVAHPGRRRFRRRVAIGVCGVVVGLALVIVGMTIAQIWLGVIGFAVMVAAGAYAFKPGHAREFGTVQEDGSVSARPNPPSRSAGTFMQRLEERWERRRGQGGW
ncbi:DUF3040 domain-containing protein [Flexivirga sp.]|uniref:DUF3040 domain-containing protein n=1 Tax=Flexivirga sp. TaxID=1962927 RepID=UPI003F81CBC1